MAPESVPARNAMNPVPVPDTVPEKQVCWYSFWHILMLDNPIRRLLQDPKKILHGHIRPGMTVIDIGCGPGDFTRVMAAMAGRSGHVIAIDLQDAMLRHAQRKCSGGTGGARITWHQCHPDAIGITTAADFALSFYMVHEVPDQDRLFGEVFRCLNHGGRYLIVEPVFHVEESAFAQMLETAQRAGFIVREQPPMRLSRAVLLEKT
jgi:ubiquinone/menaquinone biosynthesis C-methylase UbiE